MQKTHLFHLILLSLWLCWPSTVRAQAPERVVLVQSVIEERGEKPALSLLFTVTDGNGQIVPEAIIESATIQLAGGESVETRVEPAQSTLYLALMLDTSVTMGQHIDAVKEAAKAAVDNAPPNAYISVSQFDETDRVLTNFTNDHTLIKKAIDLAKVSTFPVTTCLYSAVSNTVTSLNRTLQSPQERKAILLITDGQDELHHRREVCSGTYDEMMNLANPVAAAKTPVYTIGYCLDGACSNLDIAELNSIAVNTAASLMVAGSTDLGAVAWQVMDTLKVQWLAQAEVTPGQGENQATLSLKLGDLDRPLTTAFTFASNRNYIPPTPPPPQPAEIRPNPVQQPTVIPRLELNALSYTEAGNRYSLSVSLANPQVIDQLAVKIEDEGGVLTLAKDVPVEDLPLLEIDLDANNFTAEQKYNITVSALDQFGQLIEVQDEDNQIPIRVAKEFTHTPVPPTVVEFSIESVTANYVENQLILDLDIKSDQTELIYEGFIVDETGQRISDLGRKLLDNRQIIEALPEKMKQGSEEQKYQVALYLSTKDDQRFGPQVKDFSPIPPSPPGFVQRVGASINLPMVWGPILVIFVAVIGWVVVRNLQNSDPILGSARDIRPPVN